MAEIVFSLIIVPPESPPMHRCQTYRLMNPLTGIWAPHRNALGYRYASPSGDGWSCGISTTHSLARHSATHSVTCKHDLPQSCGGTSSDHCSLITAHSSYTFSAKEKDSETGLSYFGARYYSSDLSIWLSVDPMSDKYPSLSPYVYCADNPVKLVDPNGEAWETEEDAKMADSMIENAKNNINRIDDRINELTDIYSDQKLSRQTKNELNDLIHQRNYLNEGISNLTMMGNSEELFHFKELKSGNETGFSRKQDDGIINIYYLDIAMAWHECVHIGDSKAHPDLWAFDKDGYLKTTDANFAKAEYHAYKSQFSFDPSGFVFIYTKEPVKNLSGVIDWVKSCGFDQPVKKDNLQQ